MPRLFCVSVLCLVLGCGGGEKEKAPSGSSGETLTSSTEPPKPNDEAPPDPMVDPGDEPPPVDDPPMAISIDLAIRNLTADDPADRLQAVNRLANAEYDPKIGETVAAGLIRRLGDVEKGTRTAAVTALKKWARSDDVEAIAGLFARTDEDIRHRAIAVLAHLKTPEAVTKVATRLTSAFDREQARLALIDIGPLSEPELIETYVEDPDAEVRLAVVLVLHDVGTRASVDPLATLQEDPDPRVATAAARALMEVEGR